MAVEGNEILTKSVAVIPPNKNVGEECARPHFQGRKTCRPASRTADALPVCAKHENRQSDEPVPSENIIRKSLCSKARSNSLFSRANSLFLRKNSLFC